MPSITISSKQRRTGEAIAHECITSGSFARIANKMIGVAFAVRDTGNEMTPDDWEECGCEVAELLAAFMSVTDHKRAGN